MVLYDLKCLLDFLILVWQLRVGPPGVVSTMQGFLDKLIMEALTFLYLAHVIEQPNFRIPNPQYLQRNFCFDFFNDSENTF